jgi:hypothetical protein
MNMHSVLPAAYLAPREQQHCIQSDMSIGADDTWCLMCFVVQVGVFEDPRLDAYKWASSVFCNI